MLSADDFAKMLGGIHCNWSKEYKSRTSRFTVARHSGRALRSLLAMDKVDTGGMLHIHDGSALMLMSPSVRWVRQGPFMIGSGSIGRGVPLSSKDAIQRRERSEGNEVKFDIFVMETRSCTVGANAVGNAGS